MKKMIMMLLGCLMISNVYAAVGIILMSSSNKDPLAKEKREYIQSMTLTNQESYLNYVIKIKKAFNSYISEVKQEGKIQLNSVQMKDFINTLMIENQKMLISDNLFKKDNLEFSADKEEKFELIINHANKSQCNVIIHQFLEDKYTSYMILNNDLGNDLVCNSKDNKIKLSIF